MPAIASDAPDATAAPRRPPTIRPLDRAACDAILARNDVGRLAFTFRDRVDIEPLHYAYDGDWLFVRTSPGTKLAVLGHHPWVAFEVDEVRGPFEWVSVVVHGTAYRLRPSGAAAGRREYQRALDALRRAFPPTFGADDPVAYRQVVIGLHVNEVTGRAATG